jgi:hypothetical protein
MHGLPVRQQDNPEVPAFHFVNSRPAADSTIRLDVLALQQRDDTQNPFVLDYRSVVKRGKYPSKRASI